MTDEGMKTKRRGKALSKKVTTEVIVEKAKGNRSSVRFEWGADDPNIQGIYRGVGLMLKEILTPEEAREFLDKFADQVKRAKETP